MKHSLISDCKNRRPYNLYCVGGDVKPCSINQSINLISDCTKKFCNRTLLF